MKSVHQWENSGWQWKDLPEHNCVALLLDLEIVSFNLKNTASSFLKNAERLQKSPPANERRRMS
jgi:hypothetical protein